MSENAVAEAIPGAVLGSSLHRGQTSLEIAPAQLVEVCLFLRDQQHFSRLSGVTSAAGKAGFPACGGEFVF